MASAMRFDEILEAVDRLPLEDQETLIAILEKRRLAQRRESLAKDVAEARREFEVGPCPPQTPAAIREALSS